MISPTFFANRIVMIREKKKSRAKAALVLSDLLPVTRDFAFVLDATVASGDVIKAAAGADKALISGVTVFDVFEGGTLAAEGRKSLAYALRFRAADRTLTADEASQARAAAVREAAARVGAVLRG